MLKKLKRILFYIDKINYNTIKFNYKYFPLKEAIILPVLISKNTSLVKLNGNIKLNKIKTGVIRIGYGDVPIFDKKYSRTTINIEGNISFDGNAYFGHGSKIYVAKKGELKIGENFQITAESAIMVNKSISIGNNCLISWECLLLDSDQHLIKIKNQIINKNKPIIIEDNVWVGCRNTILKGTLIKKNTIIGACSLLSNEQYMGDSIIAGNPGKIIKTNITSWE